MEKNGKKSHAETVVEKRGLPQRKKRGPQPAVKRATHEIDRHTLGSVMALLTALEEGASLTQASIEAGFCRNYLYVQARKNTELWALCSEVIERRRKDMVTRAMNRLDDNLNNEDGRVSNKAAEIMLRAENYGGFKSHAAAQANIGAVNIVVPGLIQISAPAGRVIDAEIIDEDGE